MELSEAIAYVDSLNLSTEPIDFATFTDDQLLAISITLDLISLEEALEFEKELEKRCLTEKYHEMRNPKS